MSLFEEVNYLWSVNIFSLIQVCWLLHVSQFFVWGLRHLSYNKMIGSVPAKLAEIPRLTYLWVFLFFIWLSLGQFLWRSYGLLKHSFFPVSLSCLIHQILGPQCIHRKDTRGTIQTSLPQRDVSYFDELAVSNGTVFIKKGNPTWLCWLQVHRR